jgi:hypothetical protein
MCYPTDPRLWEPKRSPAGAIAAIEKSFVIVPSAAFRTGVKRKVRLCVLADS